MAKKDKKKNKKVETTPYKTLMAFDLEDTVRDMQNYEDAKIIGIAVYAHEDTQYNIQYNALMKDEEQVTRWVSGTRLRRI